MLWKFYRCSPKNLKKFCGRGNWGLGAGDWELGTGGLGAGDWVLLRSLELVVRAGGSPAP